MEKAKKQAATNEIDQKRVDRFVTQASDNIKVTPPPAGDTTDEDFRDYRFPRMEGDE